MQILFKDHAHAAGGIESGNGADSRQGGDELAALLQGLGVRVNHAEILQLRAGMGDELMIDAVIDLTDDRHLVLEEQVVVEMDAAGG